jgi:hypothetical protein
MASNLGFRKEVLTNKARNQGTLFTSPTWLLASHLGFMKEVLTKEVHNQGTFLTSPTWLAT